MRFGLARSGCLVLNMMELMMLFYKDHITHPECLKSLINRKLCGIVKVIAHVKCRVNRSLF